MIVETLVASVAVVTVFGTWLGLRFAERELHPAAAIDKRRAAALEIVRRVIAREESENTLQALLATRPGDLPDDVRARAVSFLLNGRFEVPKVMGTDNT